MYNMGILDRFRKEKKPHYVVVTTTMRDYYKFAIDKGKKIEQPQESTQEDSEGETLGRPDYDAIDKISLYDPTISGASNIFNATLWSGGYSIVGEDGKVEQLKQLFMDIDFDRLATEITNDFYLYGTAYINVVVEDGNIITMQKVPPHYIKRAKNGKEFIYETAEGEEIRIKKANMIIFDYLRKKDYSYPMSIFEPGLELLEDAARMNEQFRIMIEEYVAPILHTKVGGDSFELLASQEDIDRIAEDVEESKRIGTELTTDQLVEMTFIQPERGMNMQPFIEWFSRKILLCTMIPEPYMMYRSGAAAGGDSMRQVEAFHNWIRLIQQRFIEPIINKHLIPMLFGESPYDDDGTKIAIQYDKYPKFKFNPVYDWKMRELNYHLKQVGVITLENETRKMLGLKELSDEELTQLRELNKPLTARNPDEEKMDTGEENE